MAPVVMDVDVAHDGGPIRGTKIAGRAPEGRPGCVRVLGNQVTVETAHCLGPEATLLADVHTLFG